ncbi:MAG: NFACT RNA binding domain-containing protein [Candidatus Baltobacteraceae bacterium]
MAANWQLWMYTDWLLIRRAAQELDERFRGAKVQDVGQLADGRLALALWRRGATELLAIDIFAPTPLVTIASGELSIQVEPGFVRSAGAMLRGTVLGSVRSRRGDRMLRLDFASRSRFGVTTGAALICELVPRFGNVILLKDDTVVAAVKEFSPAQNRVRSVQAGDPYEPPPLSPSRLIPKLISDAYPPDEAQAIVDRALDDLSPREPLFVYRRDKLLVQAHIVPLEQFAELASDRAPALLPLLTEARESHAQVSQGDQLEKKRRALGKYLSDRERKTGDELRGIEAKLSRTDERERLREAGEAVYATLHELDADAQTNAKTQALEYFAQYKRLGNAVPHLQARHAELTLSLAGVVELAWEVERAGIAELEDVADAVAGLEPRRSQPPKRIARRKRKPLTYCTPGGSRILVGRSPAENGELTFKVARPDDLWFHTQQIPGAHVILQRDDKRPAPLEDILMAAGLAAFYSKAKASPKVTVDYTLRKHVRKQPSAPPGLVFYTNPNSVHVAPSAPTTSDVPRTQSS